MVKWSVLLSMAWSLRKESISSTDTWAYNDSSNSAIAAAFKHFPYLKIGSAIRSCEQIFVATGYRIWKVGLAKRIPDCHDNVSKVSAETFAINNSSKSTRCERVTYVVWTGILLQLLLLILLPNELKIDESWMLNFLLNLPTDNRDLPFASIWYA